MSRVLMRNMRRVATTAFSVVVRPGTLVRRVVVVSIVVLLLISQTRVGGTCI